MDTRNGLTAPSQVSRTYLAVRAMGFSEHFEGVPDFLQVGPSSGVEDRSMAERPVQRHYVGI